MALKPCRECGKEVSTEAKTCPHCGRLTPTEARLPKGSGCLIALGVLAVLWFIGSRVETPQPGASGAAPAADLAPKLAVEAWSWHSEYGYVTAEGRVRNTTSAPLEHVQAVASFYDRAGTFISSGDALIQYDPLLPGQSSPFQVMATHNPAMAKAGLEFKVLFGGRIAHTVDPPRPRRRQPRTPAP